MPTSPAWSAALLAGVGTVAEPRWSPDGHRLAWVRATPLGSVLVVDGVPVPNVTPVGTRGGTFDWIDDRRLVVVVDDGLRIARRDDVRRGPLVAPAAGRAAAPAVHPAGRVAFVDETDDACRIMVAPLAGERTPRAVSRADFAWDPAWSPDGMWLAWHEWDEPAMPWDASRIVVARFDGRDPVVVAGAPGESVGQPRFAPAGPPRLACVSDRDGWANIWVVRPDGSSEVGALAEPFEHAEPSWGPGQRSYAWSPTGDRLAWCRNEEGFGRLVDAPAPDASTAFDGARAASHAKGWHHGLDWGVGGLACIRSGARTSPTVVTYDASSTRKVVDLSLGVVALPIEDFVEPAPVTWRADDGTTVPGLRFVPPDVEAPPLLVHLHGGPTDQSRAEWSPRIQYWVARGWAVLAPNPRGSTGYGRAHAEALHGRWGEADVTDVLAGIRWARGDGWCDPTRVALVGGSAGGFTALLVAERADGAVRAVVVSYPVADLEALAADTHRFERHYTDVLVGPRRTHIEHWRDRSPRTRAARLRVPVLVLHGDADPVVPLAQSVAFVDAVRAAGGDATLHVYPGEGHGWKQPATSADALQRTSDFLMQKVITS